MQGKNGKDYCVYPNPKKNQKLGTNVHEAFALIVTKADTALAWASINVNKYVTFCYLQIVLLWKVMHIIIA